MLLLDTTHTSHTHAQTGIQRVSRSLFAELRKSQEVTAICYDPYQKAWRELVATEEDRLKPAARTTGNSRGALWSTRQRYTGRIRRWLKIETRLPSSTSLICPEFFSSKVGAHLPAIFSRVTGPRVALFYDAIPLQFPELTPPGTVARFPAYLRELVQFDGIAAISETSAGVLRDYWRWLGVSNPPPVVAVPLAIDARTPAPVSAPVTQALPRILCVCTIEGRKNHLALLEACEDLWKQGLEFELQLIGLARNDTAAAALEKIAVLQHAARPLLYEGVATNEEIEFAYGQCSFTVYPSLVEGFGLPVLESLGFGKPCICSAKGALGESAQGGGCVALESVGRQSLATAIKDLLTNGELLASLSKAARLRCFNTWSDYARDLVHWTQSLKRRD
jgi:glycosyltransferase involved in cell wall biosynthesis